MGGDKRILEVLENEVEMKALWLDREIAEYLADVFGKENSCHIPTPCVERYSPVLPALSLSSMRQPCLPEEKQPCHSGDSVAPEPKAFASNIFKGNAVVPDTVVPNAVVPDVVVLGSIESVSIESSGIEHKTIEPATLGFHQVNPDGIRCNNSKSNSLESAILTREVLDVYQAVALAQSLRHMLQNSLFYKNKLAKYHDVVEAIDECARQMYAVVSKEAGWRVELPQLFPQGVHALQGRYHKQKTVLPCDLSKCSFTRDFPQPLNSLGKVADRRVESREGETIDFYAHRLSSLMEQLPFTTADELRGSSEDFLALSQNDVAGIISLPTSGTTGKPKRIFCSEADLERTVRFFAYGMRLLLEEKEHQRVLLLMSGKRPGSVGQLLSEALGRWCIPCDIYGFPADMAQCLEYIAKCKPTSIVGLPSHIMALNRMGLGKQTQGNLKTVLLSGEWTSPAMRLFLERELGCLVYTHYGLTESGLAGAVECSVRQGCHLREADIIVSIVDEAGKPVPDGKWGEIVLTTINRQATPLLRYKTGDWGRLHAEPCPCGSVVRRIDAGERMGQQLIIAEGKQLGFGELDAVLYALPWVLGYTVIHELDRKETGRNKADSEELGNKESGGGKLANGEAGKERLGNTKLPTNGVLAIHLDCLEPLTFEHFQTCISALQGRLPLWVVGGRGGKDVWWKGAPYRKNCLPVIIYEEYEKGVSGVMNDVGSCAVVKGKVHERLSTYEAGEKSLSLARNRQPKDSLSRFLDIHRLQRAQLPAGTSYQGKRRFYID